MRQTRASLLALTAAIAALSLAAASSGAAEPGQMNDDQKTLYALGAVLGRNVSVFQLSPSELKFVTMGLEDQVRGRKLKVDLGEYGPKVNNMAQNRQSKQSDDEKKKGQAYLEKAAKDKGTVKTKSGLLFQELKPGTGSSPKAEDRVKVHYRGTLIDGTEFDSSYKRNEPAEFPLNGVIPCWTEGLQKMKVGGKARLVCPSDIAYGDQGHQPQIPGGATLVFEVELLDILK